MYHPKQVKKKKLENGQIQSTLVATSNFLSSLVPMASVFPHYNV